MPNIILLCCQIVSNTAIDMQKLLSLPPNLVSAFYELENVDRTEWFCTSDPVGMKLGSGGGTTWLLREWQKERDRKYWAEERIPTEKCIPTEKSIPIEKRILLHAGGQSRRLPGYAPAGKILTPIPVFRWARGQKLGQNLLSLQLPLYEKIMERAPERLPCGKAASRDSRCRCGVLWTVGRPVARHTSWCVYLGPESTGILGFHASETLSGRIGKPLQDTSLFNGYRHLAIERPGR